MDVGSPKDGLNKTSNCLKNDESFVPEELNLDFLINKDDAENYFYDEFAADDKFQLDLSDQPQQEPHSFSSDFRYCHISESTSGNFHSLENVCHGEDLDGTRFMYSQEKLHSEFQESYQINEAENYLRDSVLQVDSDANHHELENNSSTYMQKNLPKQDASSDESLQNSSNSSLDKTGAEILQHEGTQSEFADNEIAEAVSVVEMESFHLSPGSCLAEAKREDLYDSRSSPAKSKKLEYSHLGLHNLDGTLQLPMSPGTREMSESPKSTNSRQQCTDKSYSGRSQEFKEVFPQDYLIVGKEDPPSLQLSSQKCENTNSSERYDSNHTKVERSQSHSPSRQKNSSSTSKRNRSRSCSRSPHKNDNDSRSVDIDTSALHSPYSKRICSSQNSERSLKEVSSSRSCRQKHDSPGRSALRKEVASTGPTSCANRQNPASPQELQQRFKNSPPRHTPSRPKYRHSRQSPRSTSPARKREFSSGYKRDHRNISQSRYLRSRDNHRRHFRCRSPLKHHSTRRSPRREYRPSPHRHAAGVGKPGRCLFVAGFCFKTRERDLERKFSKFGRVQNVRIIRDKRSGDSRGFGFLSLEKGEEADEAIRALNKTEWNGRVILVEKSKTS